jgi:hypothetical protein
MRRVMKGRSAGKTIHPLEDIPEGIDATHMLGDLAYASPADMDQFTGKQLAYIQGGANLEAARAEYELEAKRARFFSMAERAGQGFAIGDISLASLLHGGLFRTVSERAILCAWGWQLEATKTA